MNPIVFDRNVKKLQQSNAVRNPINTKTDYLKDEIACRLADRFLDIKKSFHTVLDAGCGSGHLIKHLDSDIVTGKLIQMEMSKELLYRDEQKQYDVETERVVGDMEQLPFEENTFDAVVSSLSLHWVNDLPGTLIQFNKALKPDGVFLGAIFGGDTLYELRTSLQLAEVERTNGISPHISPMVQHQEIGSLLTRAGLTLTTVDVDEVVVNYPSMFELMEDLQAMGESNALLRRYLVSIDFRKHHVSKDVFMAAAAAYKAIYGNKDGSIPATFQVIYMIGWKPSDDQPKPLPRGSAKHSFKDIDSLDKVAKPTM
ncbi:S-adenosyl-L-methionine-dependent methyltransferase [Globomyces pollinis-pini]|nr:S-adenosyl-L-methionine-dependent methyltransferase [Globomyces pollinis-pini]